MYANFAFSDDRVNLVLEEPTIGDFTRMVVFNGHHLQTTVVSISVVTAARMDDFDTSCLALGYEGLEQTERFGNYHTAGTWLDIDFGNSIIAAVDGEEVERSLDYHTIDIDFGP